MCFSWGMRVTSQSPGSALKMGTVLVPSSPGFGHPAEGLVLRILRACFTSEETEGQSSSSDTSRVTDKQQRQDLNQILHYSRAWDPPQPPKEPPVPMSRLVGTGLTM